MTPDLIAAAEATWPPRATRSIGAVTLRDGAGGGQRVSAATAARGWTEGDLDRAIAAMAQPLFCVTDDPTLDAALARRGLVVHDPVIAMAADLADLPTGTAATLWPPDPVAAFWAGQGIGAARLDVMRRVVGAKTVVVIEALGATMGAGFVGCHGDWAILHALAVAGPARRQGLGRSLTLAAAAFGRANGVRRLGLMVTVANLPARRLYASLGLQDVGQYHYRRPPGPAHP